MAEVLELPQTSTPEPAAPVTAPEPKGERNDFSNSMNLPSEFDDDGPLQETPDEQPAEAPSNDEAKFTGLKPEIADLIKQIASTDDWDLNDPKDFKKARQIAEKESRIREMTKSGEPSPEARNYLDAFNDPEPLSKPEADGKTPEPEADLPDYVKVAKQWKSHTDFAPALNDAYQIEDESQRNSAVGNVFLGFIDRTMQEIYAPRIREMIESMQSDRLGPVMGEVQAAREADQRREIFETLAKNEGLPGFDDLAKAASDGEIEYEGEKIPDTWMNRVFVKHPHILQIEVKGRTPAETAKKTIAARYIAAYQLMGTQRDSAKPDPTTAKTLIQTGRSIEKSKRDGDRTGLNSPGAKGTAGGRKESVFAMRGPNGELSMAELFKR